MFKKVLFASCALLFACSSGAAGSPFDENSFAIANQYCMSCHGEGFVGARAPALSRGPLRHAQSRDEVEAIIKNGIAANGMPAFKEALSDEQIAALANLIITMRDFFETQAQQSIASFDNKVFESELETFTVETVASGLEVPWSFAFLPDGRMLVAERPGRLRFVGKDSVSEPVEGFPEVWARQDGGLMGLAVHPNYKRNGWIYVSYSEPGTEIATSMTRVVRGRIENGRWVDQQDIWAPQPTDYIESNVHFGSRLLFVDGKLLFTIGDRGRRDAAQLTSSPFGKIFRINDDGSTPKDNPFAGRADALGSIWTYGHRNPHGLARDPRTGFLWSTEHGPRGGDELNLIKKGANYGWPVVTHGVEDDGSIISNETSRPGMEDPAAFWTPSISPSVIHFYTGKQFPRWRNHMLLGSLTSQELRRVEIDKDRVVKQEVLIRNLGRIRDIHTGPDGYIYIAIERFSNMGQIVRLRR
jgi:glucose/arabinose dehydrogenase